jgi:hypothetical protein
VKIDNPLIPVDLGRGPQMIEARLNVPVHLLEQIDRYNRRTEEIYAALKADFVIGENQDDLEAEIDDWVWHFDEATGDLDYLEMGVLADFKKALDAGEPEYLCDVSLDDAMQSVVRKGLIQIGPEPVQ